MLRYLYIRYELYRIIPRQQWSRQGCFAAVLSSAEFWVGAGRAVVEALSRQVLGRLGHVHILCAR